MQFKVLPVGFAAYACFASSVNAGPISSSHNRAASSASLAHHAGRVVAREPQLVMPTILPPIYIEVRPDGLIQVTSGAISFPNTTTTSNTTESKTTTLEARGKVREPTFFDKRPLRYISPILPYTAIDNRTAREESLPQFWNTVPQFSKLDNGNYYGSEKWFLLQKFNLGTLSQKDDNHEDIAFAARVFDTTPETINWFSNQMATALTLRSDEVYPEFALYEPIDHYNWIRKAHSIMARMTATQQRVMNDAIDNIDKLSTEDLYKIYTLFEVHPNMLSEHKLQAAEFFQMIKLEFPALDQGNSIKSSRPPMQLHDWNSKQHPRRSAIRPIDALARYAIPAIDSNHDDWTSQTAFKIAYMKPEQQRQLRDRVRLMPKSYAMTPRDLKDFYDTLNVDWQGKDSDAKRAEVASILCVRELVFSEMPKKLSMNRGWNWGRVPQQPAMVNSCTEEQREERLKDLFYIERWDQDHQDPQAADSASSSTSISSSASSSPSNSTAEGPSSNSTTEISILTRRSDSKPPGHLSEYGQRIGAKLDSLASLLAPGNDRFKEKLKTWEKELDQDLHSYKGKVETFEQAIDPLVHDVGDLGRQAWEKIKEELMIPI